MWGAQLGNSAYHYGYNSPLLFSDPTGLFAEGGNTTPIGNIDGTNNYLSPEVVVYANRENQSIDLAHNRLSGYIYTMNLIRFGGSGGGGGYNDPYKNGYGGSSGGGRGLGGAGAGGGTSRSVGIGITAWRLGLDAMAMSELPFLSQGAGLFSAAIDFWHGDYYGGLLSLGGMAPGIGAIADATKVARRAGQLADVAKGTGRIQGESIREIGKLANKLSQYESRLGLDELLVLEKLVEKHGGVLRYDLNPVKGKFIHPHVQIENLTPSIKSRHIWLGEDAIKYLREK